MKALQLSQFGLEYLSLVELEKPTAGPGQVLVKVEAISLNYLDLMVARGHYNSNLPLPHVPGSDAAGVVAAVGEGVTDWQPGDRVTTTFIQNWLDGAVTASHLASRLGCEAPGVFAEYVVLPAHGLVRTAAHLSSQESAALPIAGLTAWVGLFEHGRLQPGQTVLVQGTGGVSVFALQLAKAAGARVIVTSSSDEKLERARALGADATINYKTTLDWPAQVRALTNSSGADLTLDVAGTTINHSMQAVKLDGFVGLVGFIDGLKLDFNVFGPIVGNLTLKGYSVGSRASFEALNAALAQSQLKPVIDKVFPVSDIQQALHYMEQGQHFGKIVLAF